MDRVALLLSTAGLPAPLAQLTHVSPKKTVEGAVGGLLSSIGVALGLYRVSQAGKTELGPRVEGRCR